MGSWGRRKGVPVWETGLIEWVPLRSEDSTCVSVRRSKGLEQHAYRFTTVAQRVCRALFELLEKLWHTMSGTSLGQ